MSVVLVTGATGFIGRLLCPQLAQQGYTVRATLRTPQPTPPGVSEAVVLGELGAATAWDAALRNVEYVVHAAGRAHVVHASACAAGQFHEVNVRGTEGLAQAAVRAGVRRFLYLSSIKVNGESTTVRPFRFDDVPHPQDDYARSKQRAEAALVAAARGTPMEVALVRSPLVYGPGVQANFLRLMRWVDRAWVLPFGAIENSRCLVSVWSLNDLLLRLLAYPRPPSGVWLVSDGEDLATPELLRHIASALGRRVRLARVPPRLLRFGAALVGRGAEMQRLCGSLQVDTGPTCEALNWRPPVSLAQALERTAAWYIREKR
ncbi:MAG TPA: NAD-dependent epimerase/dehydratase family protein [Steroidobacteraceae bacterium]|nr:NAD-dependent epimerase/dehydratase family protein [Steroidobacteraceae bacterium]